MWRLADTDMATAEAFAPLATAVPRLALVPAPTTEPIAPPLAEPVRLGDHGRGFSGVITGLAITNDGGLGADEMERRLLEMGFVEGARIEILHEGLIGRDPIAVRVADTRVALRRGRALDILVRPDPVLDGAPADARRPS